MVDRAPVTDSFKEFIAHEIQEAHAWRTKVDEIVSPGRLGLLTGDGIFDPSLTKNLEGQALRAFAFQVIDRFVGVNIEGEDSKMSPQLFLKGNVRPSDYTEAVDVLDSWTEDYQVTYEEDPLGGLNRETYMDAIGRLIVPPGSGTARLIQRLRILRAEEG